MRSINISYNPRLDELRGIACLAVFTSHIPVLYAIKSLNILRGTIGYLGVCLFFILSGYLFSSIFLQKGKTVLYKNFIWNRILRIFPLFLIFMGILVIIFPSDFSLKSLMFFPFLAWNIPMFSGFFGEPIGLYAANIWSLAVELQFYLIFPLLFKMKKKWLILLFFITIFIKLSLFNSNLIHDNTLFIHSQIFLSTTFIIGMLLAHIPKYETTFLSTISISVIIIFLLWICRKSYIWVNYVDIFLILISCFIYSFLNQKKHFFSKYFHLSLQKLGVISYSFYLLHRAILFLPISNMSHSNFFNTLIGFLVTIIAGIITYLLIEKPFMNLRKKY